MLFAQPEPPARPADPTPVASDNPFIGFYAATRATGEVTQTLVLRLRADGRASLRTTTPARAQAAGTSAPAAAAVPAAAPQTFETGTWGPVVGNALVRLDRTSNIVGNVPTDVKQESVELSFALSGCSLKLDADPNHLFGTSGLTMTKGSCP